MDFGVVLFKNSLQTVLPGLFLDVPVVRPRSADLCVPGAWPGSLQRLDWMDLP